MLAKSGYSTVANLCGAFKLTKKLKLIKHNIQAAENFFCGFFYTSIFIVMKYSAKDTVINHKKGE